jgi:4-diphosphocytidyl-2-C-methyl-D-erythritol kinase
MLIHRTNAGVRVWCPAKVNLFLEVIGRRDDGYHELQTLLLAVGLYDTLEIREAARGVMHLECDCPDLSVGPDNLVWRAVQLIRDRFGIAAGVTIRLIKRIPMQAGLAGGSSDAAGTLAGLNCLWRLGLSSRCLGELGAELGSDVAFFFHGPAAWCTGRGEIVEPVQLARPLHLVLACPRVGLATAAVYRALGLPDRRTEGGPIRQALAAGDVSAIGRLLFNRLEAPAFALSAEVGRLRQALARLAPKGVLMSGSGSTVFALAEDAADAQRLAHALVSVGEDGTGLRVFVVRSCI